MRRIKASVVSGESGAIKREAKSFVEFKPLSKGEKFAKSAYIELAQRKTSEVAKKISNINGFSYNDGVEIYRHVFVDSHLTRDPYTNKLIHAKFDPDEEMAKSFLRIANGQKLSAKDIMLLKHERYERKLMKNNPKMDYATAHNITNAMYNYEKMVK